ncbi:MAG: hypothetical protein CMD14_09200 [Flavobacteriales bacterium]|nr:hypothetical protein [Flavobacteriales bacterium]|tara:strand:+ start:29566 stop:29850 length:285 start_codon:yes stop_codon:yes gene_type:complete
MSDIIFINKKLDEPITKTTIDIINNYSFAILSIVPNEKANIQILINDDKNETKEVYNCCIEGEEYNAWGNDDTYIENWIKNYVMNSPYIKNVDM